MVRTKKKKKIGRISGKSNDSKEEEEDIFSNYPESCEETCEHRWHLIRSFIHPFAEIYTATFLCDKCGKIKKIEGKEEI